MLERGKWVASLTITKFLDPDGEVERLSREGLTGEGLKMRFPDKFIGQEQHEGNILVNVGVTAIWRIIASIATVPGLYSNSLAKVCTGTGVGAAVFADSQATFTARVDKAMDGGYPQLANKNGTNDLCAWKGTYGSADANQAWNEFGVLNGDVTPVLLNRFVTSKGTKVAGETWTLEIDIYLQ